MPEYPINASQLTRKRVKLLDLVGDHVVTSIVMSVDKDKVVMSRTI